MKALMVLGLSCGALLFVGCATTYNARRVSTHKESSIVFTRSSEDALWGTTSLADNVVVVYEDFEQNAAGQGVVRVGLKYIGLRGMTNLLHDSPASIALTAQCHFYEAPNHQGPVVYSTPRQTLLFKLGETTPYSVTVPVKNVASYQLVIGK